MCDHMWLYNSAVWRVHGRWLWSDIWVDINYGGGGQNVLDLLSNTVTTSHMWLLKTSPKQMCSKYKNTLGFEDLVQTTGYKLSSFLNVDCMIYDNIWALLAKIKYTKISFTCFYFSVAIRKLKMTLGLHSISIGWHWVKGITVRPVE